MLLSAYLKVLDQIRLVVIVIVICEWSLGLDKHALTLQDGASPSHTLTRDVWLSALAVRRRVHESKGLRHFVAVWIYEQRP